MNAGVAVWRLARVALHLLHGAALCGLVFPFLDATGRMQRVKTWSARLVAVLGITVQARGTAPSGPVLVVSNHVSWLDILALNAVQPLRFVSKADVRRWPLVGWLVACGGTLFIERDRKRDALRVVHQVADALREGHQVAVFPEGTTSDGHGLLPFHANLLQAAVSTSTRFQPVALRFSDEREAVSQTAAYVGDTHLLESVWRIAGAHGLRAEVRWLDPVSPGELDRRVLSDRLRVMILHALSEVEVRDGPSLPLPGGGRGLG